MLTSNLKKWRLETKEDLNESPVMKAGLPLHFPAPETDNTNIKPKAQESRT